MNSRLSALVSPLRHLGRKFWVPFLSACAIVLLLEAGFDYMVENEDLPGVTQSVFNISGLYQKIVAAPRNPVPRYTAIVEINPEKDQTAIGLTDVCDQREMMTRLLYSIAKASPSVVVLDKYYLPHLPKPCPKDPDLVWAIQDLRRNNIPVIVGRRVSDESIGTGSAARYYLMPSLLSDDPRLEGIVNIDPDTRKLPLAWELFADKEEAEKGQGRDWHETLALKAARAYDDKLMAHHPRLARLVAPPHWMMSRMVTLIISARQHPYISFMKAEDFEPILVSQVLAGNTRAGSEDRPSLEGKLSSELRKLSGKIALIGEINWDLDAHPTVVGRMSGLYLQANFIEALLDDRYFRSVPILDYVLGFLILAVLELILIVYRGHWWTMALLIVGLFVLAVAVLYLTIMHLGWYVNPAPVGAIAVLIKVLHPLFVRPEQEIEGSAASKAKHSEP